MFYYAVLNENMFVVDLVASETAITDSTYISITEDQYTNGNLMWLYYKPESGQFIVCDNFIGSSDWIIYKNTDRPITPKFDYWNAKADGDHNHDENYATISHEHSTATEASAGFMSAADKAKLDGITAGATAYVHPETHPANMITETDSQKIMTAAERTKLSGIAENANNYEHPSSHPASMITGLSDVATSGSYNDLTDKPTIPNEYTHPSTHPASMITGLSSVATSGSYEDLSNKPTIPTIPESLPADGGNADTVDGYHAAAFATAEHNHDSAYASNSHTHAQSEITGLEATLAEKASTSHTEHTGEVIANKSAGPGITLQSSYGKTRIHKNSNASSDYGTIISDYGTDGKRDYLQLRRSAPSAERKLFLMSESTDGSVAQYKIYGEHNKPGILWSGVVFPGGDSTMTLSKNISDCRGGIILLWCDYDAETSTVNNTDFVTTIIPRISPTGNDWNGESFYCDVPRHIGNDTYDVTTESRIIKRVKVYNSKLEGYIENARGLRNNVVLRAIYEY